MIIFGLYSGMLGGRWLDHHILWLVFGRRFVVIAIFHRLSLGGV